MRWAGILQRLRGQWLRSPRPNRQRMCQEPKVSLWIQGNGLYLWAPACKCQRNVPFACNSRRGKQNRFADLFFGYLFAGFFFLAKTYHDVFYLLEAPGKRRVQDDDHDTDFTQSRSWFFSPVWYSIMGPGQPRLDALDFFWRRVGSR